MRFAQVLALTQDRDGAFDKLSKLVNQPFSFVNYGDLKLNPMWDDLRDDPRFDPYPNRVLLCPWRLVLTSVSTHHLRSLGRFHVLLALAAVIGV
jgi:hypothetical protein